MNLKKIKNTKIGFKNILLFFIVISGPIISFTTKRHIIISFLMAVSPAPVVFSNPIFSNIPYQKKQIEIYYDEKNFVNRSFNKRYISNIKGPDRYKSMHFNLLKFNNIVNKKENYTFFKNYFCASPEVKKALEIDFEIKKVIIKYKRVTYFEITC